MRTESPRFERILVPLDGSPFAEQALPLATQVAQATGMSLELVQVWTGRDGPASTDDAREVDAPERAAAVAYLQRVAASLAGIGVRAESALLDGHPVHETLCRQAERPHAAMLVMTTHGRTGLLRTVRGSVADGVLRHASVPVLLWRADPASPASTRIEHVLVALDGSTRAEMALPPAAALASAIDARLTLLRVVPSVMALAPEPVPTITTSPWGGLDHGPAVLDREATQRAVQDARAYLGRLAGRIHVEHPTVAVGVHALADDDAAGAILRIVEEAHADVVAMTTHARGASRLLIGSTVDAVLRARSGAMLLVRPSAPSSDA